MGGTQNSGTRIGAHASWPNPAQTQGLDDRPNPVLADQTRQARISKAPNYRPIRRQATQAIRRDLNARSESFAAATERAAANGDSRKLFQLVKEASHQKTLVCETLLDLNGSVITAREELSLRWREHFLELLNHGAAPVNANSPTGVGVSPQ